jgi:hypothetical protein
LRSIGTNKEVIEKVSEELEEILSVSNSSLSSIPLKPQQVKKQEINNNEADLINDEKTISELLNLKNRF